MNTTVSYPGPVPIPLPQPRSVPVSPITPVSVQPERAAALPLSRPVRHRRWPWILLGLLAVAMLFLGALILSFLPGREIRVLNRAVMAAAPGDWDRQWIVGVGRLPSGLAKAALAWVEMPPEARAAVQAFESADVAIYRRQGSSKGMASAEPLTAAAIQLARQGWEPLVRVQDGGQQVLFFTRPPGFHETRLRVCGLVIDDDQLVLVSATADLEPLMDLAATHLPRVDVQAR